MPRRSATLEPSKRLESAAPPPVPSSTNESPDLDYANFLMQKVEYFQLTKLAFPPEPEFSVELDRLTESLRCPNCDEIFLEEKLYCSDECQDAAATVRYVRKAMKDGRVFLLEVREGIGQRLMHQCAGGYDRNRRMSNAHRRAIFERDAHKCRICGSPADQIDHIDGSSNDPSNLRAVCRSCNLVLSRQNTRRASDDEKEYIEETLSAMALRIAAPEPFKLCDRNDWRSFFAKVRRGRLATIAKRYPEGFPDVDDEDAAGWEDTDGYVWHTSQKDD